MSNIPTTDGDRAGSEALRAQQLARRIERGDDTTPVQPVDVLPFSEQLDDDTDYVPLVRAKSKRARRRDTEARKEPGHLRAHFKAQGNPRPWEDEFGAVAFRQLMRSWRRSCHCRICRYRAWLKHYNNRRSRHDARAVSKRAAP